MAAAEPVLFSLLPAALEVACTEIIQVSVILLPGRCLQNREVADLQRAQAAEQHELQALDTLSASRSGSLAGSGQEGTSRLSQAYQEFQDADKKQQLSTLVDNWLFTVGGLRGLLCGQAVLGWGVRNGRVKGQWPREGFSQQLGRRQCATHSCTVLPE